MNSYQFSTGGDWDSTTLANNDMEVPAARLSLDMQCGRDEDGNPIRGGVRDSGEMEAYVNPQDNPAQEMPIFPGRIELKFPGHTLVIENTHPAFLFEFTRVWYNGEEVTNRVVDVKVDVDALNNNVQAYITIYRTHFLASAEVATYNIV